MSEPSVASTLDLVSILAPFGTFILGFFTAVFAEPLRKRMFRPKLKLTFVDDNDHVAYTPDREPGEENKACFIRVGVFNTKRTLAKQCRAYLVKVEEQKGQEFEKSIYADSIQLVWSCRIKGQELSAIDLPYGVTQYIDLIATNNKNNLYRPQTKPFMYRYEDLFNQDNKTLRLTVQVSGDGIDPEFIKVVFEWNGQWDNFKVYQDISA